MKYFITLLFFVTYKKSCSASICKSSYNLWSCTNATATFNEENYEEVRYRYTVKKIGHGLEHVRTNLRFFGLS